MNEQREAKELRCYVVRANTSKSNRLRLNRYTDEENVRYSQVHEGSKSYSVTGKWSN